MSFNITAAEDILNVSVYSDLNRAVCSDLVTALRGEMRDGIVAICLDMKERHLADTEAILALRVFAKELTQKKCVIGLTGCTASMQGFIRDTAAGQVYVVSTPDDLRKFARKRSSNTIDVGFINPFIEGAIETLKVQCSFQCKPGKPFLKGTAHTGVQIEIAGILGLSSTTFTGSVALCFPKEIFLKIMGNMLGETFTEITKDLEDGAGELLNIIFGQAKNKLNQQGYTLDRALPSIVRGDAIQVKHLTAMPTVVLPFETELGFFFIEIGTAPNN